MKIKKIYKAFTLIEILIATSIFALVMVITTGVVSYSAAYNSRLKAQREIQEEVIRVTDIINRDVRKAETLAVNQDGNLLVLTVDESNVSYQYDSGVIKRNNEVIADKYEYTLGFLGLSLLQQPYVSYTISVKSKNFDSNSVKISQRAKYAEYEYSVKTTVTLRSYK